MKSYLGLIPIAAKVHKRQSRMTLFCIVIAVFLVTGVFSMADMGIRMEKISAINEHGNWHIQLRHIPKDEAERVGARPDAVAAGWYDVTNYDIDEDYRIGGKPATICGVEKPVITDILNCLIEGRCPENDREILLSDNAKDILGATLGGNVTLHTPSGDKGYVIAGFVDEGMARVQDSIVAVMDIAAFDGQLGADTENAYYVQFDDHTNIRKTIAALKAEYGWTEENLSENVAVLGITGFSSDSYMMGMYLTASVLFVLVLTAGVLMIAGSINSNVAERTQFFGMLRCIGASRRQIIRFVRLEALNWCKLAIPVGVLAGVVVTCALCAVLRFGIGGEFADMPVLKISAIGVIAGVIVGILTVLLAAQTPAKHAARVSPVAAVTGSGSGAMPVRHAAHTRLFKIETALGIHHTTAAKKNLMLMTGSFALSIILFLSFSAVLAFTAHALTPLRPYAPDLSIMSDERTCSVDAALLKDIAARPGVKRVFGRMFAGAVPIVPDKGIDTIDLISYEAYQFDWAKADVLSGDIARVAGDSGCALTVFDQSNPLSVGDTLRLGDTQLEIAGVLSDSPFDSTEGTPTLICSEETFSRLTGEGNYAIIDIQLTDDATEADANSLRAMAGAHRFSDRRASNRETIGTYWAFTLLVYGFLAIIAMITVFNIINSIAMSVSARIKQYGAMRAVGMVPRQLTRMLSAEACAYAVSGCVVGCALGLPLHRFVFQMMVTDYWGDAWRLPVAAVVIILLLVAASAIVAVYAPSKRIAGMAVTDTINEL